MTGITVTRRNGNLLACKSARPEASERIRHEAELLKRLQHPGIVQFVDFVEGSSVELYLGFVGPDSWATQPPATSAESIEALASAASTVADLHKLGTVHGALRPEHVLVAPDKRPVLCGLADATASSEAGRARDLAGLAALIDHLAAACEEKERRQLASLARRAERGSVTAGDLTAELDRLHGRPRKRSLATIPRPPIPRPSRRVLITAVAVLGVAVLGWTMLRPGGSGTNTPELATPTDAVAAGQTPAGPAPTSPMPVNPGQASPGPTGAEPENPSETNPANADPVPETDNTATITAADTTSPDGNQIRVDEDDRIIIDHQGRRYGVGRPGDKALIGDWTCDGTPTLALLQPSTGTVAVFASWPAPSRRLQADYVTVIDGATDLRNDPSGGCDQLRVTHAGGSTLIEPELP